MIADPGNRELFGGMMTEDAGPPHPLTARAEELVALYSGGSVSVADLLCDARDPLALAYRIVGDDLTHSDLTYGALSDESRRFASVLAAHGVAAGDRVATLMGKSRQYLVTLMSIWRLGAVHVPLFTAFAPPAIAFRLSRSAAKVVVCDGAQRPKLKQESDVFAGASWQVITTGARDAEAPSFHDLMQGAAPLESAVSVSGDAPIIHIYTSGTTGTPKGVVVPVRALAAFRAYAEFALDLRPSDLYWCAADPGWAYGLYFGVLATFTTGTPSLLLEGGFSSERTLAVLAGQGVTNFAAAPTVYRSLRTACATQKSRLRCASSAGEPLTPDVNRWAGEVLGVEIHDHYGQTEAGMLINNHHHQLLRRSLKPESMGQAMPGWTAVVLDQAEDRPAPVGDVGRVAMDLTRSPLAWFSGYLDDDAKTAEKFSPDGRWYLTGDVGRVDEDGYFHFSSRDDDVIIMAGYRIGPFEVESVLVSHPSVAEAAVIAVPDEVRGEVIEAYVVPHGSVVATPELAAELQKWVKVQYAAHAYPRAVHFTDTLPRTTSGKVQRFVLRQRRRAELEAVAKLDR